MQLPLSIALQLLGLESGSDERLIRRAYARRLKQIDLAKDPDAFQELRYAYEAALGASTSPTAFEEVDDEETKQSELPAATRAVEISADPLLETSPLSQSLAVLETLKGELGMALKTEAQAKNLLDKAMADPRLGHLDAQQHFEALLAQSLCQGWQPGHEVLFQAACRQFDWLHDKPRLLRLGSVGELLDFAILQWLSFLDQPEAVVRRQSLVIQRLRNPETPTKQWLREELFILDLLAQRHGFWLKLIAPIERIDAWRKTYETQMGGPRRPTVPTYDSVPTESESSSLPGLLAAVCLWVFLLSKCSSLEAPAANSSRLEPRTISTATA